MSILSREPKTAASRTYDLIIIGGGIYGAMLTYEASCEDCDPAH
jgi:glycerol-3-phosphate dehydrogenase